MGLRIAAHPMRPAPRAAAGVPICFGFRANQSWTRDNTDLLTSEGNRRPDIDGTRARWIYVNGESPAGRSGLLIMACPANFNSPEPLRIWNEEANGGRGDVFINFAPTKNTDWTLHPGHPYPLRYRLYAYDDEMTPQRAEQLWRDFANPPAGRDGAVTTAVKARPLPGTRLSLHYTYKQKPPRHHGGGVNMKHNTFISHIAVNVKNI